MAFLSNKNIAFLAKELKQFYGEAHYDFIDDNIAYEAREWFKRQPTVRDIQRLGGLYRLNEDFISYFSLLVTRNEPAERTIGYPEEESHLSEPHDFGHNVFGNDRLADNPAYKVKGEQRRPIIRDIGQLQSTNDIFDEITLGGMKVGDYLNDREKLMMKHDIFRGRTKGRGHLKIDRPVASSEVYHGCHCQDCGQDGCTGCDTDVYYSRANRCKLQLGAENQTTGSTLSELSTVKGKHVPDFYNRQLVFERRYPAYGYSEDIARQPTRYVNSARPISRHGMDTESIWSRPNHITEATLVSPITRMITDYPIDHKSDPGHIGLYALQPQTRMHSLAAYKQDMFARQFPRASRNTAERVVAMDNANQYAPDRDFNYERQLYAKKLGSLIQ
jgi:hypothetical protein